MDFDQFARRYGEEVDSAVAFSGRSHLFFLRAKVRHLLELARARCGDPGELTVLDVGCGTGILAGLVVPHVRRLVAVDIATAGLSEGRRLAPSCRFVAYDGGALPFAERSFDLAYMVCVLHHVAVGARELLMQEVARVVRPGGVVVVFEHNPWNPLTRHVVSRCPFDRDAVLVRRPELSRLMVDAGLVLVDHAYILVFPWQSRFWRAAEARLGKLPLGAQYWAAAERPAGRDS